MTNTIECFALTQREHFLSLVEPQFRTVETYLATPIMHQNIVVPSKIWAVVWLSW